jgi:hypothetical protein
LQLFNCIDAPSKNLSNKKPELLASFVRGNILARMYPTFDNDALYFGRPLYMQNCPQLRAVVEKNQRLLVPLASGIKELSKSSGYNRYRFPALLLP